MDDLKDYVKEMKKLGYSEEAIKERLLMEGFDEERIAEVTKQTPWMILAASLIVVLMLVALGITAIMMVPEEEPVTCYDRECITARAVQCQPTIYQQQESTSTIEYKIDGCRLTKTVIRFEDIENAVIQNYFLDKSMICRYNPNEFKKTWLLGITSGMEDCYGPLRDSLELV